MKMELNESCLTSLPSASFTSIVPSCAIIAFAMSSPARPQMSTTLL